MASLRQQKVSRLLQRDLGEIFQRESRNYFGGVLMTVTTVRISPDLSFAKVYLSIFPSDNKEEVMLAVNKRSKEVRHLLGQRVRHQLRIVPQLHFIIDDSLDYAERIDALL